MNDILKQFLKIGLAIGEQMVPGVAIAEAGVKAFKTGKTGEEKRAAVIELAKGGLMITESVTDKDLLNDPDFDEAAKAINDGYVKLLRVIERRAVATSPPA